MSNPEVAPKATELLDPLKPYRSNTWCFNGQASSSEPWEFSVGEFYGCVCHRAFDELARSPIESHPITGLKLPEQALKKAAWDQRLAPEVSSAAVSRIQGPADRLQLSTAS
jgi:hypothetical protein